MTTVKSILKTIINILILAIVCLGIFVKNLVVGVALAIVEATKKSARDAEEFFLKKKEPETEILDAECETIE